MLSILEWCLFVISGKNEAKFKLNLEQVKHVHLDSVRQLGPHFDNRVAQLVTYRLLGTCMNIAEHEHFTQYKRINHHIINFTID